jgi:hypothetical protein
MDKKQVCGVYILVYQRFNGFGLCVRAGFGAQNCQYTTKVDAR